MNQNSFPRWCHSVIHDELSPTQLAADLITGVGPLNTPRDYVEKSTTENLSPAELTANDPITLATVVDRFNANQPVTDQMINDACRQMDSVYHFKDANKATRGGSLLKRIMSVF